MHLQRPGEPASCRPHGCLTRICPERLMVRDVFLNELFSCDPRLLLLHVETHRAWHTGPGCQVTGLLLFLTASHLKVPVDIDLLRKSVKELCARAPRTFVVMKAVHTVTLNAQVTGSADRVPRAKSRRGFETKQSLSTCPDRARCLRWVFRYVNSKAWEKQASTASACPCRDCG